MNKEKVSVKKTVFILLSGITAISFGSILIRLTTDVSPIMIATYRLIFSAIILTPFLYRKRKEFKKLNKREWVLCILSGSFLAVHFITWISSLQYTSIANSVVLVTMNPIFVGALSYFFLKEKLTKNIVFGVLLSILGTFVLTFSSLGEGIFTAKGDMPILGNILALTGAVMASFYIIIGSKIREKRDLITYISIVYTVAAILLVIISVFAGLSFTGYKFSSYFYMLLLAVIPQMIGHTSYNWALRYLKSSMVAITTMGEPIGATILAYFIFNETLSMWQILGILIIFIAIWLASKKSFKQ